MSDRKERRNPDEAIRSRSSFLFSLFALYLRFYFRRSFHAVRIARDGLPPALGPGPVILYSNHPSWWDPAVLLLIGAELFPRHKGYGPIDSEALKKYALLGRMGVFPVPQNSRRGGAVFLRQSLAILSRRFTILAVTAEGRFSDCRTRPVILRPGLSHLARRVPNAVILPLALEYAFWNESRPEVLLRFGPPVQPPATNDVSAWTVRLEDALTDTMERLAVQSIGREPNAFHPLLHGTAGVGGVYDLWRMIRATFVGQRFDASHGGRK